MNTIGFCCLFIRAATTHTGAGHGLYLYSIVLLLNVVLTVDVIFFTRLIQPLNQRFDQ